MHWAIIAPMSPIVAVWLTQVVLPDSLWSDFVGSWSVASCTLHTPLMWERTFTHSGARLRVTRDNLIIYEGEYCWIEKLYIFFAHLHACFLKFASSIYIIYINRWALWRKTTIPLLFIFLDEKYYSFIKTIMPRLNKIVGQKSTWQCTSQLWLSGLPAR